MPKEATWVNDFSIIEDAWTHGLDVRAIDYCTIRENEFHSMQLILGQSDVKNDKEIRLLKHGGDGGSCKQWVLKDHDYITKVQYQFNTWTSYVDMVLFTTNLGDSRQIGQGEGPLVTYFFADKKQFLGLVSVEVGGETYAFGTYDTVCNHLPKDYFDPDRDTKDLSKQDEEIIDNKWTPTDMQDKWDNVSETSVSKDKPVAVPKANDEAVAVDKFLNDVFSIFGPKKQEDSEPASKKGNDILTDTLNTIGTNIIKDQTQDVKDHIDTVVQDKEQMAREEIEEKMRTAYAVVFFLLVLIVITWCMLGCLCCYIKNVARAQNSKRFVQHREQRGVANATESSMLPSNSVDLQRSHARGISNLQSQNNAEPFAANNVFKQNEVDQVQNALSSSKVQPGGNLRDPQSMSEIDGRVSIGTLQVAQETNDMEAEADGDQSNNSVRGPSSLQKNFSSDTKNGMPGNKPMRT